MASKRFLMVPVLSSAARMPRPGSTSAPAILFNASRFTFPPLPRDPSSMDGVRLARLKGKRQAGAAPFPAFPARSSSADLALERLDAGESLALHPFQEGAAGG